MIVYKHMCVRELKFKDSVKDMIPYKHTHIYIYIGPLINENCEHSVDLSHKIDSLNIT